MTKHRTQLLVAAVAALAAGLAIADESRDPPRRARKPIVTVTPELRAELAALQAARKPVVKSTPLPVLGEPMRIRARLEAIVDGHLVVSVAIPPDQQARMLGVQVVLAADEIGDNAVFRDRLYARYPLLDPEAERQLIPLGGQELELELRRTSTERPFVTAWRAP